jgi:hypothetical protein
VKTSDYIECFLHWRGLPNRNKIQRLHEMWFEGGVPLVIELEEPASSERTARGQPSRR